MRNYKFKVGDKVKIIKNGGGFPTEDVGKIVKIVKCGVYCGGSGYKVEPKLGNSRRDDSYNGMNGESSLELVSPAEVDDWKKRLKR